MTAREPVEVAPTLGEAFTPGRRISGRLLGGYQGRIAGS